MNHKELSNTGIMIPEIGLGTWRYRGGAETLREGIKLGASLIDTAEGYHTEDVVGEAIKGIRDDVFLATKVSGRHLAHDDVLRACEDSLYRLGTDYIDLYQIHWPNYTYPLQDTMRALEKLADRGLVKYLGVSNFDTDELLNAMHYLNHHPIVSNQVLYNLNSRGIETDLIPFCEKSNITILAYTPLDDGRLCKKPRIRVSSKMQVLEDIAKETGRTMAQVSLNWCNSHPNVVSIPKSNSVERTVENCGGSGWHLSDEQIERLNQAFS